MELKLELVLVQGSALALATSLMPPLQELQLESEPEQQFEPAPQDHLHLMLTTCSPQSHYHRRSLEVLPCCLSTTP